ncbi:uncharacterized protein EAF01_003619 [Botrytis porri]|uniref:uncharacterized protein n=1 Tax=Botrytis porri TaxID=87229 RepID=UPI00190119BC|nr:uncharacterized protein EAF01_003619 [Botrytis porri]KAF7909901.1 hypothetical protein EAF01_003619 [Botrytis porri]
MNAFHDTSQRQGSSLKCEELKHREGKWSQGIVEVESCPYGRTREDEDEDEEAEYNRTIQISCEALDLEI